MRLIPDDGFRTVKELRAPAFAGRLPDWVRDASDGGSVTARDASRGGGHWTLRPADGEARAETSFAFAPDAYDAVELRARVSATSPEATVGVGFAGEAGSLRSWVASPDAARDGTVRVRAGGETTTREARLVDPTFEHDVVLRWEADAGAAELHVDGTLGARVDDVALDASAPSRAVWSAEAVDGRDSSVRVHAAALRYRERGNTTNAGQFDS